MENIPALQEKIRQLEAEIQQSTAVAQKYELAARELQEFKEKYAEDLYKERQQVQQWHDEARQWLHAYEQLRVQKGGFGFRSLGAAMTASGIAGMVLCFAAMYLWQYRGDDLSDFKRDHLFQIEYALSQGNFQEARQMLDTEKNSDAYPKAKPAIQMLEHTIIAAEKGCKK